MKYVKAIRMLSMTLIKFYLALCLMFADPPFTAQETLRAWQKKNHPWLELSDVHRETTEGVRVTVIPFYMGSRESQNSAVYWVRGLSTIVIL